MEPSRRDSEEGYGGYNLWMTQVGLVYVDDDRLIEFDYIDTLSVYAGIWCLTWVAIASRVIGVVLYQSGLVVLPCMISSQR